MGAAESRALRWRRLRRRLAWGALSKELATHGQPAWLRRQLPLLQRSRGFNVAGDGGCMISGFQSRADGASPSTARGDIDATRERLGDTLEELGTRLNPQRLKQQAKDKVREATIGRVQTMAQTTMDKATGAGRKVTDIVRENPIPAAMIAAGISWLVWNSRRGASSEPQSNYRESVFQELFG